jgi:hypothetical protein
MGLLPIAMRIFTSRFACLSESLFFQMVQKGMAQGLLTVQKRLKQPIILNKPELKMLIQFWKVTNSGDR